MAYHVITCYGSSMNTINLPSKGWLSFTIVRHANVYGVDRTYPIEIGSRLALMLRHDFRDKDGYRAIGWASYYLSRHKSAHDGYHIVVQDAHWKMLLDVLGVTHIEKDGSYTVRLRELNDKLRYAVANKTKISGYVKETHNRRGKFVRVDKLRRIK